MTRLNLKEASLLDVSGELNKKAHKALMGHIRENTAANGEYQEIREGFGLLEKLPPVELTARQKRQIPARIVQALQTAFHIKQVEKQARQRQRLIHWALVSVASAAAVVAIVTSVGLSTSANHREREQVAKINATIDRFAAMGEQRASSYELAVTDVEASIRQLQTESPTLSEVHDKNMGKLLDALATLPMDNDDLAMTEPGSL